MPKSSLTAIAADLKPTKAKRRRKGKNPDVAAGRTDRFAVYEFKGEGVQMIRRTLYLTAEELAACQRAADADGVSVTRIIRRCIRQSLKV